jgi:hypothetical protein
VPEDWLATLYWYFINRRNIWHKTEKFRISWDVLPCSQINVDIVFRTRQYIPEDSELHNRRRENLKSQIQRK